MVSFLAESSGFVAFLLPVKQKNPVSRGRDRVSFSFRSCGFQTIGPPLLGGCRSRGRCWSRLGHRGRCWGGCRSRTTLRHCAVPTGGTARGAAAGTQLGQQATAPMPATARIARITTHNPRFTTRRLGATCVMMAPGPAHRQQQNHTVHCGLLNSRVQNPSERLPTSNPAASSSQRGLSPGPPNFRVIMMAAERVSRQFDKIGPNN